jgi:YD repeat-containing protein
MTQAMENSTSSGCATNLLATYTYDYQSRRTNLAYGNGASIAYSYTNAGDVLTLNHDMSGTSNDPHYTFTYTAAHQLGSEAISDSDYVWQPASTASASYSANTLNQYSTVGGTAYSYDGNGNLTGNGVFTYAYDAQNRLLSAAQTGATTTYAYDPLGRRIAKTAPNAPGAPLWGSVIWDNFPWTAASPSTAYYLSDGTDEIAEYSSVGALTTRYVPGPAIDEPIAMVTSGGTKSFFHANHQGSIVELWDLVLRAGTQSIERRLAGWGTRFHCR